MKRLPISMCVIVYDLDQSKRICKSARLQVVGVMIRGSTLVNSFVCEYLTSD